MAKMKKKQQNEKLISGWQLQNQYMDHNVEFCKRAGEITKQVRDAIEAFDSKWGIYWIMPSKHARPAVRKNRTCGFPA